MCKEPCISCPACTPDVLAVSVDGNRKLYRIQSNTSTSEQGNFEGVFIEKDEEVAEFMKYIQRHTNDVPGKGLCGSSSWTAAKESTKKSTGKLDEEGMEIAVCRHGVLLAALNMFRGEIFAYPLFLQRKLAASVPGHITFLCSDVACKYFPYLTKVAQLRNLLSMRPFLSVMHAKAHIWKCEIKWGGAFQDGAGSTVGKEVGQVNRRTDMLTLLALGWNKRKVEQLGRSLSQRYLKIIRILREQMESLNATKNELGVDDDTLQQWVADVQKWAEAAAELQTKRKVFEKVMAVRRLREEEMILCREMRHHWTVLRMRSVVLGTISSDSSLVGMSEDAQKGLHSLVLKKQSELKAEMLKIKDMYKRILSHQPLLEMDSEEEEDIPDDATESGLSTSDED
ncbi:C-type lectin domain family 4 member M [Sarotherodon galilaeus]